MQVGPRDRILELNCGEGEVSLLLAARALEGLLAAMDPSDDSVRRARAKACHLDNVMFFTGGEDNIPWKDDFFSKALSHGPPENLAEVRRVLIPGGILYFSLEKGEAVDESASRLKASGFIGTEVHPLREGQTVITGRKPA